MLRLLILLLLIFSSPAFAMFCPDNFRSISLGDSLEFVLAECGNPTTQFRYERPVNSSQSWDYYLKTHPFSLANTKLQILFKDDKVINLQITESGSLGNDVCELTNPGNCQKTTNVRNVTTTLLCGAIISVGDTSQKIESACGKPAIVNQLQAASQQTPAQELIALKYDGQNPATLIFENGGLIERL